MRTATLAFSTVMALAVALGPSSAHAGARAQASKASAKAPAKAAVKKRPSKARVALKRTGQRIKHVKARASKHLRIPQLTASLERGLNHRWTRAAARTGLALGGAAISSWGVYKYGMSDLAHMGALGIGGANIFALSFVPNDHFWGRLRKGLLGAHETKLGIALSFLAHDPFMQAGALFLSLHGSEKVAHAVFKKEHKPAH